MGSPPLLLAGNGRYSVPDSKAVVDHPGKPTTELNWKVSICRDQTGPGFPCAHPRTAAIIISSESMPVIPQSERQDHEPTKPSTQNAGRRLRHLTDSPPFAFCRSTDEPTFVRCLGQHPAPADSMVDETTGAAKAFGRCSLQSTDVRHSRHLKRENRAGALSRHQPGPTLQARTRERTEQLRCRACGQDAGRSHEERAMRDTRSDV